MGWGCCHYNAPFKKRKKVGKAALEQNNVMLTHTKSSSKEVDVVSYEMQVGLHVTIYTYSKRGHIAIGTPKVHFFPIPVTCNNLTTILSIVIH